MKKLDFIFKSYISILFLRDIKAGIFLFFLSFLLPSVGILGITALLATVIFAEFINMREDYLKYGFYLYNSLLVGMGIGYYYDVTATTILLSIVLSVFTFFLSFAFHKVLSKYALPILSLPFAFVSMVFYLASLKYTMLLSNILHRKPLIDIDVWDKISAYLKSLGTIVFLPYNIAGIAIMAILFIYSRILFFLALLGFYVGVAFHSFFVPFGVSMNSAFNFNFILIAMALGGVFLVPHIKNYFLALIGVVVSVILIDAMEVFFNIYALPVYTLPFNVITLLFILLLYSIGYKYFNYHIKGTPEKSLIYFLSSFYRFGGNDIKINLPFSGEWSVYQAFNGKWTHKGNWKYAYDFVIRKNGKTYANEGLFLEDYYAFGKPVLSPVNGYVTALRDDLPDNIIGSVDRENNWGNYIIIKSDYGYFVEISHLMQHSLTVKVGDYVKVGDIIAKCGNSGYSPEPHIHIQVQKYGFLGSETLPFRFVDYIKGDTLYYYSLPKENENIKAVIIDKSMKLRLTFILDDEYKYALIKNNEKVGEITLKVKMNDKGEFYFEDNKKNRLYFYTDYKLFYFYLYDGSDGILKEIFKLSPKIPLISSDVKYFDILPPQFLYNKIKRFFIEFALPFNFELFNKKVEYKKERLKISSKYGEVLFSFYEKGFEILTFNDIQMRRIHEKNDSTAS